tara:strand:+ start:73 stop:405 length:333 start_codon:yes stop_codon:yes gene_type:complete
MKHILFDLIGCPFDLLDSETHVKVSLFNAAKKANSKVLDLGSHKFEPQGVSGYALLADSHISMHTWPEKGVAKCDIFTCGEHCKPYEAVEYLKKHFLAEEVQSDAFDRLL